MQVAMIEEVPGDLSGRSRDLLDEASLSLSFGDVSSMVTAVQEAESYDPEHELFNSPELWARVCRIGIFVQEPDLVWPACERALAEAKIDSSDTASLLPYIDLLGTAAALSGNAEEAITDFQFTAENSEIEKEVEIHESWILILRGGLPLPGSDGPDAEQASRWNRACWFGSLRGLAPVVLPACELAVELAAESQLGAIRDSRGLARALTGDAQGAIADFDVFVAHFAGDEDHAHAVEQRQEWIAALEQGLQPIDLETLESLAGD
jgi:hypothetical protein